MKTLIKTSIFMLALAGVITLMSGVALAAPAPVFEHDAAPWMDDLQVDTSIIRDLSELELVPEGGFPDGGGDECVGCDEDDPADDGGDEGVVDEGDDEGIDEEDGEEMDDGGDEGVVDEEQNPPVDEGDDTGKTDDEQTPPASSTESGKKLPNTGTQLAIIGGIGLLAAMTALFTRKALNKRMR